MTLLHKTEKINHFDMHVMNALVQQHRPTAPSDAHHRQVHSTV